MGVHHCTTSILCYKGLQAKLPSLMIFALLTTNVKLNILCCFFLLSIHRIISFLCCSHNHSTTLSFNNASTYLNMVTMLFSDMSSLLFLSFSTQSCTDLLCSFRVSCDPFPASPTTTWPISPAPIPSTLVHFAANRGKGRASEQTAQSLSVHPQSSTLSRPFPEAIRSSRKHTHIHSLLFYLLVTISSCSPPHPRIFPALLSLSPTPHPSLPPFILTTEAFPPSFVSSLTLFLP